MSLDFLKGLWLTLSTARSTRMYPAIKITDADYLDDLAIISDCLIDAAILLHQPENRKRYRYHAGQSMDCRK